MSIPPRSYGSNDTVSQHRIGPSEVNPIKRIFKTRVKSISLQDDIYGMDVSEGGNILRFKWDGNASSECELIDED